MVEYCVYWLENGEPMHEVFSNLARYINDTQKLGLDLTVIPMKGWQRKMYWQDTGLPWVGTSPQIPTAATALYYVTTGILGDTNLSVGIGTTKPFYYVGAPFAEKDVVADKLNSLQLPGVYFRPTAFIPAYGAFAKELCQGVEIYITDAADMAREYGVEGFVYWHYWFGNGKRLLERQIGRASCRERV